MVFADSENPPFLAAMLLDRHSDRLAESKHPQILSAQVTKKMKLK